MDRPGVKYSRLSNQGKPDEAVFDFGSVYDYSAEGEQGKHGRQFDSIESYDSVFKYRGLNGRSKPPLLPTDSFGHEVELADPGTNFLLLATSWFLTAVSYIFLAMTFPFSYFFLVQKMGEFDRMVVFRLGKMIGVKGPGRFIVFPWMDRTKKIDVRASAFAVPPQQFITCDGGIVEMGAEIQFGIVDVVTMISEVRPD